MPDSASPVDAGLSSDAATDAHTPPTPVKCDSTTATPHDSDGDGVDDECVCKAGYVKSDKGCIDIDECATKSGGCDLLTTCTNSAGSFSCSSCPSGYRGSGLSGCADIDECATDNGGCDEHAACNNKPGSYSCDVCLNSATRDVTCASNVVNQTCVNGAWTPWTGCYNSLGAGECRQADGMYALEFAIDYYDLMPSTDVDNTAHADARCESKCWQHSDWCVAIELINRPEWPAPGCSLITDVARFEGAGNSIDHNEWAGIQVIDGDNFQTYCGGDGTCTNTNWAGGSLNPRDNYRCFVRN
jgi:hypothetical protein